MKCKDKFMIQSAVASPGATMEDAGKMFNKEAGHVFRECKLRVVYSKPTESSSGAPLIENQKPGVLEVTEPVVEPHDNNLQLNKEAGHVSHECKLQVVYSKPTESSFGTTVMENPNSNVPEVIKPVVLVEPVDTVLQMSTRKLLDVQPPELQFPLSLEKELSCSLQLSNVTENHVAFKVKTASPKYLVQPHIGVLLPQSMNEITVKMQAPNKVPSDIQNEDKFLIQSVVAPADATTEDVILDMFDKARSPIEECALQVVYISNQEKNSNRIGELILIGIIIGLLGLVFGLEYAPYLLANIFGLCFSVNRSLAMLAVMLIIKMIKEVLSDSVEDLIVKICMHLVFRLKDGMRL
ncbi:hypothetical protein DH2020_047303 [Rehmannia glutinosa]|uniref:MSP domain-containing protein n=1 Tax=Rehmannia glutinosa TaxID=99300 RepID=A0ABR0U9S3_REHGL